MFIQYHCLAWCYCLDTSRRKPTSSWQLSRMTLYWYSLACALILFIGESWPIVNEDGFKFVCRGDDTELFKDTTLDDPDVIIVLSIILTTPRQIGKGNAKNFTVAEAYKKRVSLDVLGNIVIRNVQESDEALYTLTYQSGSDATVYNITLSILVSPSSNCKPNIRRLGDILYASLDPEHCGKPAASVYWLPYPSVTREEKDLLVLPSEFKAATYYACIESPAIRCARNANYSDYCSGFTPKETSNTTPTEHTSNGTPAVERSYAMVFIPVVVILVVIIAITISIIFFRSRVCRKQSALYVYRKTHNDE